MHFRMGDLAKGVIRDQPQQAAQFKVPDSIRIARKDMALVVRGGMAWVTVACPFPPQDGMHLETKVVSFKWGY